jgi:hypothetical protein
MSKNKITLINTLSQEKENNYTIDITDKNLLSEAIVDLSIQPDLRIHYIEKFYEHFGEIESLELINRLSSMYQISGTKILEKYMYDISTNCKINAFLKITTAKSLCYFNPKQVIGYQALNIICEKFDYEQDNSLSTPVKIDAISLLMNNDLYKKQSLQYFCEIINNIKLDCDYRYKTILSLENKTIPEKNYFIKQSAIQFFNNTENKIFYRILAGQLIIQKYNDNSSDTHNTENILLSFASDTLLDYNLRADSADVILKLGSEQNKIKAKEIIMILGRTTGTVNNIFQNSQNVHTQEIEDSVVEAIEFLSTVETKTITGIPGSPYITFQYVKKEIEKKILKSDTEYKNKKDSIDISLNRIYLDRALYSKFNYTLINILLKIWTYICSHQSETEMKKRLLEELIEMSGTCSSGFAGRLVNVISGFGNFNLRISFRDQIIANFTGRLNAKARDICNPSHLDTNHKIYCTSETKSNQEHLDNLLSFQEKVLEEMTILSSDYSKRLNFLKFFRKNMLSIREELYNEFKTHITDTDFDLYFRSAISSYETGGYV